MRALQLLLLLLACPALSAAVDSCSRPTTAAAAWRDAQSPSPSYCSAACAPAACLPAASRLPACDATRLDTDGCWADTAALSVEQLSHHLTPLSAAERLAHSWRRVWLPRTCAYTRFPSLALADADCPRLRSLAASRRGTVWWVLLLGDESARAVYCSLFRLLVLGNDSGGELLGPYASALNPGEAVGCGGSLARLDKPPPSGVSLRPLNATHGVTLAAAQPQLSRVFSFQTPDVGGARRARFSYAYVHGLAGADGGASVADALRNAMNESLRPTSPFWWLDEPSAPDELVFGAAAADYAEPRAHVAEERRAGLGRLMRQWTEVAGSRKRAQSGEHAGRFWLGGSACNGRFPAAHADSRLLGEAGAVLDMLNFTAGGEWERLTGEDGVGYGTEPGAGKGATGELAAQAAHSLLGHLCVR